MRSFSRPGSEGIRQACGRGSARPSAVTTAPGAHDAGRAHEQQVLHVLGVLQSVGGCQVASQGVPHQHHLVDAHGLSPAAQSCEEKGLGILPLLGPEGGPACSRFERVVWLQPAAWVLGCWAGVGYVRAHSTGCWESQKVCAWGGWLQAAAGKGDTEQDNSATA